MTGDARKISAKLKKLGDKKRAAILQRFFKTGPGEYGEGDVFLGIKVGDLRKVAREFSEISGTDIRQLLRSRIHDERLVALLILVRQFQRGDESKKRQIYELYLRHTRFVNNWDLVDLSAPRIVGGYVADKSRKPLYQLAKSKSLWERRIAILATSYLIKENDFEDALKIATVLLSDSEDLIHKAVGWMLREVGKRDQKEEETFLRRHYKTMPRTMLRYAIERFPESKRQRYLTGKI
ncbi:MAG: DNA alkylation repair protein [Candidatus Latescibacterota bacterium]|nr:MAG: DNA alkylation repair protein [Candidatus Latescibacterota bacterium]